MDLENELMAHETVAEATVIGVAHEKWQERPMACVVLKADHEVTTEDLRQHLGQRFPSWWVPDEVEFVAEIPRTSTGKFDKKVLRDQYGHITLTEGEADD